MSDVRVRGWLTLLVLAGLAASGWWFHREFEFHEVESRNYRTPEVELNPWLTLQRLLERQGAQVKTPAVLTVMPPPGATLLLVQDRSTLSHQQTQQLLAWVRSGGTLMVAPVRDTPLRRQPDPLLDPFVTRQPPTDQARIAHQADRHCMALLPDGSGELELSPSYWRNLKENAEPAPLWRLEDCAGLRMLAWQLGRGRLIATEDPFQFTNFRIRIKDTAPFALWLFAPHPGSVVWVIGTEGLPPLPALVARWAPLAATGFVLLVAGVLWRAGVLSGPRHGLAAAGRRSLAEHLRAGAALLWRADRGSGLHAQLRAGALERLRRRHPAWQDLPEPELARRAAGLAGVPEAVLAEALRDLPPDDPDAFARHFRTLETLRKNA